MHGIARLTTPWLLLAIAPAQVPVPAPGKAPTGPGKQASPWSQDFEYVRSMARQRQLDLLMVFVGPAADGDNGRLEQEVLGKREFVEAAAKVFVLARFDYPKDGGSVPEVLRKQNEWLLTKYPAPAGLPMLWLADSQGHAYAKTGYLPIDAMALFAMLDKKRTANQQAIAGLQAAAGKRGLERATALAAALRQLDDEFVAASHYREMLEVIGLDADGKAGLKPEFEAIARDAAAQPMRVRLAAELGPLLAQQQWPELDARIEQLQKQHADERWARQYAAFLQGVRKLDGDRDGATALALFTEALAVAPRSELAPRIELRQKQAEAAAVEQAAAETKGKGKEPAKPPKRK